MPELNNTLTPLPYSLQAEQAVLGSILVDSDCMEKVATIVKPEYFYLPQHRVIFGSMMTMFTGSSAKIDPVVIADVLVKEGHYDLSGGREYLITLRDSVPSTANVETYAKIVEEQFFLRTLIQTSQDIINQASSGEADASTLLDSAEQRIYDIRQGKDVNGPRKLSDVIVNGVYDRLDKLTGEDKDKYKAIPSGFGMLDKYITGLNKSDFILIGARPAMGKTSFALNLAQNVAVNAGKKCVFFSLEMTKEQLAMRVLSTEARVNSSKMRTGELDAEDWERLGMATGLLSGCELYFDDTSSITVAEIKAKIRRMKDVDCVIIDYLGLIRPAGRSDNRVQQVSEITRELKMMAKDLAIPVVVCAQLSRGTEGRGKSHRPQLADLRESGSIEQDADIVLMLYRKDYYQNEDDDEKPDEEEDERADTVEIIVAKNRHGPTETVKMIWDADHTMFLGMEKIRNDM